MRTIIFIGIILIVVILIACFIYTAMKYIKKGLLKVRILNHKIESLYYFTSKNYQMLVDMNKQNENPISYKFDDSWSENDPRICHALGEIDGVLLTECEEAFEKHYNEGIRVFELDFRLTQDGVPVVLHDWKTFNNGMFSKANITQNTLNVAHTMSYQEFANVKVLGKYTTLTMERFVDLAYKYSDAKFIISVKSVNQQYNDDVRTIFRELFRVTDKVDPVIKNRYILHVYSFEFLHQTMKEYPFISAVYRCCHLLHPLVLVEELKKCGISIVTLLDGDREYCKILRDNGIKIIRVVTNKKMQGSSALYKLKCDADMLMTPFEEGSK